MPQYFAPGVYVEEVASGPKPIEGVSTSVTGAVGVTVRGPTDGKPVLVTSFNEFTRKFGGFIPEDAAAANRWGRYTREAPDGGYWWRFAHAVKGFFDNGGQQLYVKRVFSKDAAIAATGYCIQGFASEIAKDAAAGASTLELRHLIAVKTPDPALRVQVINGESKAAIPESGGAGSDQFTVQRYDVGARTITLDKALKEKVSVARGDYLLIRPTDAGSHTLILEAKDKGKAGEDIFVRVRPVTGAAFTIQGSDAADPTPIKTTLVAVTAPPAGAKWVIQVAAAGLRPGDVVTIFGSPYTLSDLAAPDPQKFQIEPAKPGTENWIVGTAVLKRRKANTPGTAAALTVAGAARLYGNAIIELDNGTAKEIRTVSALAAGNQVTLSAPALAQQYREGDTLRVVEAEVGVQCRPGGGADVEAEETFTGLRLFDFDSKDPAALVHVVNGQSALVTVNSPFTGVTSLDGFPFSQGDKLWTKLTGGDDHWEALEVKDFVGNDGGSGRRTGIQALEDIEDISLVLVPGMWSPVIHSEMTKHCETLRYRFAILDPPPDLGVDGIQTFREPIDTEYAALYHPWLVVRDPSLGTDVPVPPSGHMAGIYARVDSERGVHKAPANEVIRNITGLRQDVNRREQDLLNPNNINVLRFFPGRSFRVWGARNVSSDSDWKYINVRRTFIFIERSIDEGTQWVVFEPNDATLWSRVRQTVSNFLETQWRNGLLEGKTAADAFFVSCDRGVTMTEDDIENGRLICLVGIAPVYPAEFVIFRIQKYVAQSKLSK